jgi:hypothetical protein
MDNAVAIKSSKDATRLIFIDVTKESFSALLDSEVFGSHFGQHVDFGSTERAIR